MSPASGKPTVSITLALQGSLKSVPHPRALGIGPAPMVTPNTKLFQDGHPYPGLPGPEPCFWSCLLVLTGTRTQACVSDICLAWLLVRV